MFVQTLMDVYIGQPHLDKNYKVSYLKPSKLHIVKKANLTTCVIYFKKSYLEKKMDMGVYIAACMCIVVPPIKRSNLTIILNAFKIHILINNCNILMQTLIDVYICQLHLESKNKVACLKPFLKSCTWSKRPI